jgi:capsular polysaccharide transport system permease protein
LGTQGRVVHALIIRETRTRFGDSKLGYGWALLEPIAHILMLSLVFAVLMRHRSAKNSSSSITQGSFPITCLSTPAAA